MIPIKDMGHPGCPSLVEVLLLNLVMNFEYG